LSKELSVGGLRLITTWPCIVEASYLLEIPQRFEMLKWIELGGAVVYPIEPAHLGGIARWMRRYSESGKREMDLADASLYWLAAETGVTEILTVDVADFSAIAYHEARLLLCCNSELATEYLGKCRPLWVIRPSEMCACHSRGAGQTDRMQRYRGESYGSTLVRRSVKFGVTALIGVVALAAST
jgi:predicted nucleic acid-binding protein